MSGIITDYTSLQTAVSDYLARSDLTSWLPLFIQSFEERFYRDPLNWAPWFESTLTLTISSGLAAVPSDYLGLHIAYVSGQVMEPLKRLSPEQLLGRYPRANGSDSFPQYIARQGSNFIFGPVGGDGTVISGSYFAKPALLRNASTNWLTTNAPDLLLYGALLEAQPFIMNDARVPLWQAAFQIAIQAYRDMWQEEEFSGSTPYTVAV